jgi:hypothetical protein
VDVLFDYGRSVRHCGTMVDRVLDEGAVKVRRSA